MRFQPIRGPILTATAVLVAIVGSYSLQPVHAEASPREKSSDAKQQVEALEEQWRVAELAGDTATMGKMLSDDYLGITVTGEVDTKGQQLRRVTDRRLKLTRIELSDMKVKLIGRIAIVTSQARLEGTIDGRPLNGTYRYTRIYQRLPSGHWKITSFEATREHKHRDHLDEAEAVPR
ncbi:MAG TPA: nuclear transport factor 2 family protein [Edaphobacter sp.]|nr:nuclear transport factor 2 family protein [Edaphobacter sp.]